MPERSVETPDGAAVETPSLPNAEKPPEPVVSSVAPAALPAPAAAAVSKDPVMKRVENVLEEGLADVYKKMDPTLQEKFNKEGDRVANLIAEMVRQAKVKTRDVLRLISNWLKLIPHVNRYFLEQEAKLKTDKIIELAGKEKLP